MLVRLKETLSRHRLFCLPFKRINLFVTCTNFRQDKVKLKFLRQSSQNQSLLLMEMPRIPRSCSRCLLKEWIKALSVVFSCLNWLAAVKRNFNWSLFCIQYNHVRIPLEIVATIDDYSTYQYFFSLHVPGITRNPLTLPTHIESLRSSPSDRDPDRDSWKFP